MIKDKVITLLSQILTTAKITLLTPKSSEFGDYAIFLKEESSDIKNTIKQLLETGFFSNIQQQGNFINFYINPPVLLTELRLITEQKEKYGAIDILKNKKMIVEFAHPNTHKLFHIGHARNITTGEALSRILTFAGAKIIRANYQGDVGLHIAKCLWQIKNSISEIETLNTLEDKIAFLGKCYTKGTNEYERNEKIKEEINTINRQIYEKNPAIKELLEKTRAWSLEYYDKIYKRFDTKFDRLFFESEVADEGLRIAKKAQAENILEESDGAVVFRGDAHGVDTRVFINSLGLPTYETKELGLGELEFSEFGNVDRCIHVVGNDHLSYFKTVFKVQEILNTKKYKNKQLHYPYGFVNLKEGKMSSRVGNIIEGNWLLDEVKNKIIALFKNVAPETAEILAVGAVKYGFLKVDAMKNIAFDIDESVSLQGNSGPYLQYAYARMNSILSKSQSPSTLTEIDNFSDPEISLLRALPHFTEVVESAAINYAPHLICTHLFDLTQKFNLFYEKCPILKAEKGQKEFRLALTSATAQILKNGLNLLGIEVLEKI